MTAFLSPSFLCVLRSLPPRHNLSHVVMIFAICVSHPVSPFSPAALTLPPSTRAPVPVGEHHQHELPEAFPSGSLDQAAEAGLHHPYPAVDLRTIFQGPPHLSFPEFPPHKDVSDFSWQCKNLFCVLTAFNRSCSLFSPPTGSTLRLSPHCYAFLHIRHHWDAGTFHL